MILMNYVMLLQSEVRLVAKKLRDREENPLIWDFTKTYVSGNLIKNILSESSIVSPLTTRSNMAFPN